MQRVFRSIVGCFVICVIVVISAVIANFAFGVSEVVGVSMQPTYKEGSFVVYMKQNFDIRRDNVIIFKQEINGKQEVLIKRVVATEGQTIHSRHGSFYVNDKRIKLKSKTGRVDIEDYQVPHDMFFVLGDNYENSQDSRSFGPVRRKNIIGVVLN